MLSYGIACQCPARHICCLRLRWPLWQLHLAQAQPQPFKHKVHQELECSSSTAEGKGLAGLHVAEDEKRHCDAHSCGEQAPYEALQGASSKRVLHVPAQGSECFERLSKQQVPVVALQQGLLPPALPACLPFAM